MKKGKPKCFSIKGQIDLSRTRKVKNLSQQRHTSYGNKGIIAKMHIIIIIVKVKYPKADYELDALAFPRLWGSNVPTVPASSIHVVLSTVIDSNPPEQQQVRVFYWTCQHFIVNRLGT
jgi:hypothetical protein